MRIRKNTHQLRVFPHFVLLILLGIFSVTCEKVEPERLIIVRTDSYSDVTKYAVTLTGTLYDFGEREEVSDHGFCFSLSSDRSNAIRHTSLGGKSVRGAFSETVEDLTPGTKYYVWAYASSGKHQEYGDSISFETLPPTPPEVETGDVTFLSPTYVECTGNVTEDGGAPVTERGVCWDSQPDPARDKAHFVNGSGTGTFTGKMDGLTPGQTYHYRVYAINSAATSYGTDKKFTTPHEVVSPEITTHAVTEITSSSAVCGGTITFNGYSEIIEKGICWSLESSPALQDLSSISEDTTDEFSLEMTGLLPDQEYHVRAFAINTSDTAYGNEEVFRTEPEKTKPTVVTKEISDVGLTSAIFGGIITSDGHSTITEKGVCWGLNENPTISDYSVPSESTVNDFNIQVTGLTPEVTYHVRAYAINEIGIAYGIDRSFTTGTSISPPQITTHEVDSITWNSAICGGSITDDGGGEITEKGICWSRDSVPTLEDYSAVSQDPDNQFSLEMSELLPDQEYHVRAYAINAADTAYGNEEVFTTLPQPRVPTLATKAVTGETRNSASSGGTITDNGGSEVTEKGICWGPDPNPDTSAFTMISRTPGNDFDLTMTGLAAGEQYHVRAYAKNSTGTGYGGDVSFTTLPPAVEPTVVTHTVTEIHATAATSGGTITDDGGDPILAKGLCWATHSNPTLSDSHMEYGSGPEPFSLQMAILVHNQEYYVSAYATNSAGTGYGDPVWFKTRFKCGELLVDARDGKSYMTVLIGDQCWMAENLDAGIRLDTGYLQTDNSIIEKYCYDDNPDYCDQFGAMYSWNEMMQYTMQESAQGVCPDGWHVPSDGEWKTMELELGMGSSEVDSLGWRGAGVGGALKSTDTPPWNLPNTGATNSSQFSALPSGMVYYHYASNGLGDFALWWTSTPAEEEDYAYYRYLYTDSDQILRTNGGYQPNTTPVRCVTTNTGY